MRSLAALALMVGLGIAPAAAAQQLPTAESYVRGVGLFDVAISPDGARVAVASGDIRLGGDTWIFQIINLDNGRQENAFTAPSRLSIYNVGWLDEQRAFYQFGGNRLGVSRAAGRNVESHDGVGVVTVGNTRQRVVPDLYGRIAPAYAEAGAFRFLGYDEDYRYGYYRVDAATGAVQRLANVPTDTAGVIVGADSNLAARIEVNNTTNQWRVLDVSNGRVLLEGVSETGAPPQVAGLFPDGRWALLGRLSNEERDFLYAFNPADGTREVVGSNPNYDITNSVRDPWTGRVVGYGWTDDYPRQHFFDPQLQAAYDQASGMVGGGFVTIANWSRDRSRIVLLGEAGEDAGAYYLFEPAARNVRVLRWLNSEISGVAALGRRQAIQYRARDGVRVPGYLTLPAQGDRNLPLVVLVHGGPHARDDMSFDPWSAYLASRGFAVLQPNFRGSTGYGYAWFDAGRGNWGDGVMQNDVSDGVDALIQSGVADPNRICIVGASYGGYAALAGATLTPERYRCAVAIAGVSDLMGMLNRSAQVRRGGSRGGESDWWRLSIGDRRADREHLEAVSPANLAANVRAPILLMHGSGDTTVPVEQSRLMRERLDAAGKDVRYIEFPNEQHYFYQLENRTRMLQEMGDFVAQNIGQPAH